jgi:exopolyphosphatase/guanosine-5'-triphosphate,3'-diphosphate pyrophosphatase
MKRLGIIDIGSNSVRLLLAEISPLGVLKIVDELKESVRLGADMIDGINLNEERISKAVTTLKTFKEFCDAVGVEEIIAVATEAVRKAANKDDFIKKIKEETGISIRILTGNEEAYYDYLGVINSMHVRNSLIIDIGGSSTELIWVQDNSLIKCISLPFGAVNLTQRFNLEDLITTQNEDNLKQFLINTFKDIPWLSEVKYDNVIGIGGTVRNIGKIDRKNKRYTLDIHHNYEILTSDVHSIYCSVKSKSLKQRKKVDGLSRDRSDIFIGPACAIVTLLDLLDVSKLVVSGKGLREGLLYEYVANHFGPIGDPLDFTINNVMLNHNVNINHANNVFFIATLLFEKLKPLHHLDDTFKSILKTAAKLHDCGLSIRYYDHHKHSFYMILNSEINALSHKELIMSAYVAASHRNNEFDLNIFQFHGIINRIDLTNVEKMGALLRIAESLDKSMSGLVTDIDCSIEKDTVTLKVYSNANIELELNDAKKSAHFFYEVYDKNLILIE